MSDKNLIVIRSPQTEDPWPIPPPYVPPYSDAEVAALSIYLATPAGRWVRLADVFDVLARYNLALAQARREVWQYEGMLHDRKLGNDQFR